MPADGRLRTAAGQTVRIRGARRAAEAAGLPFFINARTDVFFQRPTAQHDDAMVSEALERAQRYRDAGADGLFAQGLVDIRLIARLAAASGIDVASVRIAAFAIGGGIAGLAGGLVASLTGRAALALLSLEWSLFALAVGSAGGPGTIVGPALLAYGFAVALQWLDVPGTVRLSLFAILAIIVVVGATARVRAQPLRPPRSGVPNA